MTLTELLRSLRDRPRHAGSPEEAEVYPLVSDELQPIADALTALETDLNMLKLMAQNCLTRYADPRNKQACENQLHTPDVYEAIVRIADTITRIIGEKL
jgi:hypothetical protein